MKICMNTSSINAKPNPRHPKYTIEKYAAARDVWRRADVNSGTTMKIVAKNIETTDVTTKWIRSIGTRPLRSCELSIAAVGGSTKFVAVASSGRAVFRRKLKKGWSSTAGRIRTPEAA